MTFTTTAAVDLGTDGVNLDGGGVFRSMNRVIWADGRIQELANLENHGSFELHGDEDKVLTEVLLSNYGTVLWLGAGKITADATIIDNFGTFDAQGDALLKGMNDSLFRNIATATTLGVVKKTNGLPGGTSEFDIDFRNEAKLVVENGFTMKFSKEIRQYGSQSVTELLGGTIDVGANGTFVLQNGVFKGGGTVTGGLRAEGGVVEVGGDSNRNVLWVSGVYTQQADAKLRVVIHDVDDEWVWGGVFANGGADLDGALEFFMPDGNVESGESENIVNVGLNGAIVGDFNPVQGWDLTYLADAVFATKQ